MLKRVLSPLQRPFARWLLRTVVLPDPWQRFPAAVPLQRYGAGACREFDWYFEGESCVPARTLAEVQAWLLGCEYRCDPDLFNEVDFWQHPLTFEQVRKGDCEDFALWAWRKLVRMGHEEAEFVAGQCVTPGGATTGHAWVCFEHEGCSCLLDGVLRDPGAMIRTLAEVQGEYIPEVSVDGRFRRYAYGGYYRRLRGAA